MTTKKGRRNRKAKSNIPRSKKGTSETASQATLTLAEAVASQWGITSEEVESISTFMKLTGKEKLSASRKIVQSMVIDAVEKPDDRFLLAVNESETLLRGYSTLDDQHRSEIQRLIKQITSYLTDPTRKRPFNALMLAAPGAGKSHFIKQLANSMRDQRVQAVTFNMANMQTADDIAQPVDELRNVKVNDRFPLLFLDEFDSDPARFASLLPLLWDGELQIGHRDLKLGKAVIVLAGSNPDLPKAMNQSGTMRLEADATEGFPAPSKLIDLLSRINGGVINIPDLDLRSEERDRRVDKVCVSVALIKGRFGTDLGEVPRALLRFIAHTTFRYGVRSIAHLVDVIESEAFANKILKKDALGLPFGSEESLQDSSLRLHLLDKDKGFGIVNRWKEFSKDKVTIDIRGSARASYLSLLTSRFEVPWVSGVAVA